MIFYWRKVFNLLRVGELVCTLTRQKQYSLLEYLVISFFTHHFVKDGLNLNPPQEQDK